MVLITALPFHRGEALAGHITVDELAGPRYVRLLHGVYVRADISITPRIRALAALKICDPGSWVSHHTAGVLWGGWMPDTADTHVTVPDHQSRRSVRRGVFAHRARPGTQPIRRYGVPLSSPLDTFLDLATLHIDLVDLVVAGDSLVKTTSLEPEDLVGATDAWSGRGARFARRAAAFVRAGVDSAPESKLRMLLVLAGLPEPTVNLITRTETGEWKWRFDLCYPEIKLIVEYDGEYHEGKAQRPRDLTRREAVERAGWRIIVITKDDLFKDPASVLVRVRDALRDRGCTGVRRNFAAAWQQHFLAGRTPA